MTKRKWQGTHAVYKTPEKTTRLLLLMILLIWIYPLVAQTVELSVTDSSGRALENVSVKDSKHSYLSDANGKVRIRISEDELTFRRLGYDVLKTTLKQISPNLIVSLHEVGIQHPTIRVRELEYLPAIPALDTQLIHPDTNASTGGTADYLLSTSSFSSSDNRLLGERQTVSLLGSFSRHTLVMLDGVALNAAGEAFDFSKIPVSQIESIEIVKGNASSYGGASAIGGIVNIVTKSPARKAETEFQLGSGVGSFDLQKQQYQLSLVRRAWALNLNYDHYFARNDFSYDAVWDTDNEYKRLHNDKKADNVFVKAGYNFYHSALEYSLSQGSFVRELPGPIGFLDLYDDSRMSGNHWYQSLMYKWQPGNWENNLQLFHHSDLSIFRNIHPSNPINPSHYSQKQSHYGVQDRLSWAWSLGKVEGIAEYKELDFKLSDYDLNGGEPERISGDRELYALGVNGTQKYYFAGIEGNSRLALRNDHMEDDNHFSWRAEQQFSYESLIKYTIGANYGTAFSMPSLYDMYWIGDSETQGNPELKSESSRGYKLHAELKHSLATLNLAYYQNEIEDLIQWRQVYLFGRHWKPFNLGRAKIRNYEIEAMCHLHRLVSLLAGMTVTEARDYSLTSSGNHSATYGKYLTYTPKQKAHISLKCADEMYALNLNWIYTSEQYTTPDNLIDPLGDFSNLDLELMRKLHFHKLTLIISTKFSNILDQKYEIYADTPQPGFNYACGINLQYKL